MRILGSKNLYAGHPHATFASRLFLHTPLFAPTGRGVLPFHFSPGNVDYRKARYIILPEFSVRQALFVDSKAEKSNSSATMQMSQLALAVRQVREGMEVEERGDLSPISVHGGERFITTTLLSHYYYEEQDRHYDLNQLTLAAIPNGALQDRYNPGSQDTIWIVGRNAPSRGEQFRARLSFHRLKLKAGWRIQRIQYDSVQRALNSEWDD